MRNAKLFIAIVVALVIAAGIVIGRESYTKRAAPEADRQASAAAHQARLDAFALQRAAILGAARQSFVDGDPEAAVRILEPYVDLDDPEVMAIWKIALPQATQRQQQHVRAAAAEREAEKARRAEQTEQPCRDSLQCWGDKHSLYASTACAPQIEAQAKYQAEWTDGWLGSKFDQFRRGSTPTSVIYMGNQVKFQNGFGAWSRVRYECEFEPEGKRVLRVHVEG